MRRDTCGKEYRNGKLHSILLQNAPHVNALEKMGSHAGRDSEIV